MLTRMLQQVQSAATGQYEQVVPGLSLVRFDQPRQFEAMIYEPLVCLILQGQKETVVAGSTMVVSAGQCIVVSHAMPVVSRVPDATPQQPYLSLVARLDLAQLRSLQSPVPQTLPDRARAFAVTDPGAPVLDVFGRYLQLMEDPDAVEVMAPLIRRELHFRLLRSSAGSMLRRLLHHDSHASNIARAIHTLRGAYREKLEMAELARSVGMSPSSFYRHFKSTTATTPLQYQKDLRLTEARQLLLGGHHSVSTAAFAVGYESASQFSREYARKFGTAPRFDLPGAA